MTLISAILGFAARTSARCWGDEAMSMKTILAAAVMATLAATVHTAPANAQATRTWVGGMGDDGNPCSRSSPCRTFAGAMSKTASGGEVNCIDSGGFGALNITKSINVYCEGVAAGVLAAGTTGVTVNAPGRSSSFADSTSRATAPASMASASSTPESCMSRTA